MIVLTKLYVFLFCQELTNEAIGTHTIVASRLVQAEPLNLRPRRTAGATPGDREVVVRTWLGGLKS